LLMRLLIVLLISIGFINANLRIEIPDTNGITFSLRAAEPDSYDHLIGGGKWSTGIDTVKGNYYAVGEPVSLLLQITTDETFSFPSSAEFHMELVLRQGETVKSVVNNCKACKTECSANGAMVVPTFTYYPVLGGFYVLQFKGLTKNTRTVIRIDLTIESDLDTGCWCKIYDGGAAVGCACPTSTSPRTTHLSSTKRDLPSKWYNPDRSRTLALGFDEFTVALFITDYYINDKYFKFPIQFLTFEKLGNVLNCLDYTGCFIAITPGRTENTYKDRTCEFVEETCDDGEDETYDQCVPPMIPNRKPNMPPNCIHTGWDDPFDGYCYYFDDGYNCEQPCTLDEDCEEDGGCYGSAPCTSDLGDDNSVQGLQQEKNLESANSPKQQSVGSLSPLQLFGIIGGCVCLVVIAVVVIYKFFQSKSINEQTIANLQVPFN